MSKKKNPIFPEWLVDTPIDRILGEAVGAASMCWKSPPEAEFDSERAVQIIDELKAILQKKLWVIDEGETNG